MEDLAVLPVVDFLVVLLKSLVVCLEVHLPALEDLVILEDLEHLPEALDLPLDRQPFHTVTLGQAQLV